MATLIGSERGRVLALDVRWGMIIGVQNDTNGYIRGRRCIGY